MKHRREIGSCKETVQTLEVESDIIAWMARTAAQHGAETLLAHADDGIIWGRLDNGAFVTAFDAGAGAELRELTLKEARAFGPDSEVYVWRTEGGGFRSRVIRPTAQGEQPSWKSSLDEHHVLWGDDIDPEKSSDGFVRLTEGAMGHLHAPPLNSIDTGREAPALQVRHFIDHDEDGVARMVGSRLVALTTIEKRS
jgi:CRISPR-associated protein (TIGR03984 family)